MADKKQKIRKALDMEGIGQMLDQIRRQDAVRDADTVASVFNGSPIFGAPAIPVGHDAPTRQSTNIDDRRGEVLNVNQDDLNHAIPGTLSNWDALHKKYLMNPQSMAQQGQPPAFSDDLVAKLMAEENAAAGDYDNPRGVNLMSTLQDTAAPGRFVPPAYPQPSTDFDPSLPVGAGPGGWGTDYDTPGGDARSSKWRQGLRYAPWNMRE